MRRLFLPLVTAALLGVLAASASASVKCVNIAKLRLGKGDCAVTMKAGQTLIFPSGITTQADFEPTPFGLLPLAAHFWVTRVGGQGGKMYKLVGKGTVGILTVVNGVPISAYAYKPMVVVIMAPPSAKAPARIKLIS